MSLDSRSDAEANLLLQFWMAAWRRRVEDQVEEGSVARVVGSVLGFREEEGAVCEWREGGGVFRVSSVGKAGVRR